MVDEVRAVSKVAAGRSLAASGLPLRLASDQTSLGPLALPRAAPTPRQSHTELIFPLQRGCFPPKDPSLSRSLGSLRAALRCCLSANRDERVTTSCVTLVSVQSLQGRGAHLHVSRDERLSPRASVLAVCVSVQSPQGRGAHLSVSRDERLSPRASVLAICVPGRKHRRAMDGRRRTFNSVARHG